MAILGLIVLLVCVLLFTPLRYRVQANCKGTLSTLDANAFFTLFFHLVSGQVRYQNEQLHWSVRIAWKRLESGAAEAAEIVEMPVDKEEPQPEAKADAGDLPSKPSTAVPQKRTDPTPAETRKSVPIPDKKEEKSNRSQESPKKSVGFREKIEHIFEKIKYTFCQFCAKIKELLRKKEILTDFIKNEAHQAALLKGLKELKRLILRLKPKKISADIYFGFEDPSYTGYVLAGISMIYPMVGEQVNVCPDFERKVLEGSLFVKGHVRARIFAVFAWNMIINKNVRTLIRDIKNFSFDA